MALIQLKRGGSSRRLTITPSNGEPVFETDTKLLYIGDGATPGGNPISYPGTLYHILSSEIVKVLSRRQYIVYDTLKVEGAIILDEASQLIVI